MSFKDKYKVGDYVRAFDFKPMRGCGDCYCEGKIVEQTESSYKVLCEIDYWGGKRHKDSARIGKEVIVPFQVLPDYEHRIIKL